METFVIRLWVAASGVPAPDAELRGTLEQVGIEGSATFASGAELLRLLTHSAAAPPATGKGADSTPISSIREP